MTSISSIETVTQRSNQRSPVAATPTEEDLSRPAAWTADNESSDALAPSGRHIGHKGKGKGKQRASEDDDEAELSESSASASYPPVDDEESETRRVEENLRRWEIAERQRRKAARESANGTTGAAPSLVSDVTRRASILWSGRPTPKHTSTLSAEAGGKHVVLNSRESMDVPLQDISAPSPGGSPLPTRSSTPPALRNPFLASSERLQLEGDMDASGADQAGKSAVMSPSAEAPPMLPSGGLSASGPSRPVLVASSSSFVGKHPPPQPLDLPPPRTPPPRLDSPPSPTQATTPERDVPEKPTRWWHEWLCGCSEGSDRGGDYQAGRTNPFE
ncbi:hypothetical protein HGRIS_002216 [Hohenbuehelia grisea]|uniref:Uncharacterized protein n=1 Tax=Hohenbuehelia grisea TaxID=104357 RepID=A0ABR3JJU6_9AGAR